MFVLGDFGFWEHRREGVRFLDALDKDATARGVDVYFLDGNHDKTSLLMEKYGDQRNEENFVIVRPHVLYAPRGHRWTWDHGVTFIALGGAYSVDKDWRLDQEERFPGRYGGPKSLWFPEEEMSDEDMEAILDADPSQVDIMLAHDKPRSSSPRWNRKDLLECIPNQDRLQRAMRRLRPKAFFHGHLHYFYTDEVWYGHDGPTQDMATTKVMGLLCNPDAGDLNYVNKTLSWQVLDTAEAWWR